MQPGEKTKLLTTEDIALNTDRIFIFFLMQGT